MNIRLAALAQKRSRADVLAITIFGPSHPACMKLRIVRIRGSAVSRNRGVSALSVFGLAVILPLALAPFLGAAPQQQKQTQVQPKPDITSVVKVVNVLATVRDKKGEIVRNLTKNDFVLAEDDHPQDIKYFLVENDLPVTVGLLVDTSLSQRRVLSSERTASYDFLNRLLHQDKDRACVIHFDHEVEMLQDLTSSHKKLEDSLKLLETPDDRGGGNGGYGGRGRGGSRGGGTLLYDAVYLASNEVMKKEQGHKAVIILSDGVDRGSKESLQDAIEAAQRADMLVYSILFSDHDEEHRSYGGGYGGRGGYGGGGPMGGHRRYPQQERPDGKKILTQITRETGAHMFEVSKKLSIDMVYAQIEEELRNQYSLGYTPEGMDAALGYHQLTLITKQKDLVVQARDGFYVDR
jgi:VWFA-related protein